MLTVLALSSLPWKSKTNSSVSQETGAVFIKLRKTTTTEDLRNLQRDLHVKPNHYHSTFSWMIVNLVDESHLNFDKYSDCLKAKNVLTVGLFMRYWFCRVLWAMTLSHSASHWTAQILVWQNGVTDCYSKDWSMCWKNCLNHCLVWLQPWWFRYEHFELCTRITIKTISCFKFWKVLQSKTSEQFCLFNK